MSMAQVMERMSSKGYRFAVGMMTPTAIQLLFPNFNPCTGPTMVPMWVREEKDGYVFCVLGSEPTENHPEKKLPRSYFLNLNILPKQ
jgi:hypothetical protein